MFDYITLSVYDTGMIAKMQPDELIARFAKNVRKQRLKLGLTQKQLAERLHAHPPYISDLERGKKCPFLPNLAPIAEALETTPNALLR